MKVHALKIASYLNGHNLILKTIYPKLKSHRLFKLAQKQMLDGGSIITFVIKGGKKSAFNFMNNLKIIDISNNLGDTKSLVTHPGTTTHRIIGEEERKKLKIEDGMIRLSVGLEDHRDLIEDIKQALKNI